MTLRGGPLGSSSAASTVPGWRVEDFHRLETNFFEEGVVQSVGGALAVTERGAGANMSVDVAAGLALIEVTTTLLSPNATIKTWLYSDAVVNVAVPTADATNPRKDRIVAKFDMTTNPNATASNIVSIELIEGTPAGSPSAPAEPSNSITLAIVDVPASDTAIGNAQITDSRTFVQTKTTVLTELARLADLASTSANEGASLIGVEDAGGHFTGTTVEAALDELGDDVDVLMTAVAPVRLLAWVTAASTDTGVSTTSEETMSATWGGSLTIPADTLLTVGTVIEIYLNGAFSIGSSAIKVKSTLGGSSTAVARVFNTQNDAPWIYVCRFQVKSVSGSTATIQQSGHILAGFNATLCIEPIMNAALNGIPPTFAVDASTSLAIAFTSQPTGSHGDNAINIEGGHVRISQPS